MRPQRPHEHRLQIVLVKIQPAFLFNPRRTDFYVACKCSPTTLAIHSLPGELSASDVTEVTKLWPYDGPVVQLPAKSTRSSNESGEFARSLSGSAKPASVSTSTPPKSEPE